MTLEVLNGNGNLATDSATQATNSIKIDEDDLMVMLFDQYMLGTTAAMEDVVKFISSMYNMIELKQKELRKDKTREALYEKFKIQIKAHYRDTFKKKSHLVAV